jgi:hypothetical protein
VCEGGEIDLFLTGEVTGKATGKGVTCPSGIENFFKWDGRRGKRSLFSGQIAAVLPLFDGDVAGAAFSKPARGAKKIGFA